MNSDNLRRAASRASDHPALESAARVGYAVSGLLHLLIGWIALQVAWGTGTQTADQSGALGSLAQNGLGRVLLWLAVAGFLGLAVWQVADAIAGPPGSGSSVWSGRAKAAGKAVVYLALAWSSFSFARGRATSSAKQSVDFTANLMTKPGGRALVVAIGLVIVVVGIYHVVKGWRKKFLRDLEEHPGRWATRAGTVGYVAKGVALTVVGLLFAAAGLNGQPAKATGLDGALRTLRGEPFGAVLLGVMALGFAAFGLYSFARARHARV